MTALERCFTPGRFAGLLGVLVFISWADVFLGLGTFVFRDFSVFGYPVAHYHHESFWRGELPLWNPLSNCGTPFLAQWNTMTLYPGALFYLLFPVSWSLAVFCLLHLYLGGLGMYRLASQWTGQNLGAALAGLGYAFNGLMLNSLMWPNNIAALGWLPWVVLAVERAVASGGRAIVVGAGVGTLQMLTGAPEMILFTWLFAGCQALVTRCSWVTVTRLVGLAVLVGLLAAVQLLPFLDLLQHSQRDASYGGSVWALPWWGAANLFVPLFRCFETSAGYFLQTEQNWTSTFYPGIAVLLLALLAVRPGGGRRVVLMLALTGAALWLALAEQGGLFSVLSRGIPLGMMRYPVKFVALLTVTLPLLAAFGVRSVLADPAGARTMRTALIGTVVVITGIGWWGAAVPYADTVGSNAVDSAVRSGAHLVLFGLALWVAVRVSVPWARVLLLVVAVGIVWSDLLLHLPGLMPRVSRAAYEPSVLVRENLQPPPRVGDGRTMISPQLLAKFQQHSLPDPHDMLVLLQAGLFNNLNLLHDVPKVDGFFSLGLREQQAIEHQLFVAPESSQSGLRDFLSIRHVFSFSNDFHWLPRPSAMPWVSAGQRVVWADDTVSLPSLLTTNFNPTVLVYISPDAQARGVGNLAEVPAHILSRSFGAHRVECEVESPAPTLVVLAQTFYHPWRATVNGQPATILRANHAFQAVPVPAGRSTVRLEYVDRRFQLGGVLSGLGLLTCAVLWWRDSGPSLSKGGQDVSKSN